MDYKWNSRVKEIREGNGMVEVWTTNADGQNLMAFISYSPIFTIAPKDKHIVLMLFVEGSKSGMSDGKFHWIHDDLLEIMSNSVKDYYVGRNNSDNKLEFFLSHTFFVNKLPSPEYFTHGTYSGFESLEQ